MIDEVAILGSTGSIGKSSLSVLSRNKNYKIKLLTTNKKGEKILNQAIKHNVKHVIIFDKKKFYKFRFKFKKKKINLYNDLNKINKIIKKKISYTINAISGIDGLEPTLKCIPFTKNILIANKESIICGWELIEKKLKQFKTKFIPLDSEHFSIWNLINNENIENILKIILTASGGPFLNKSLKKIKNINPDKALKHPNWKMGKKISIDSATIMNKIFEFIEAKKIFNLKKNKLLILIHPISFIHAVVYFKSDLVKLLAHDTNMKIPIANALKINKSYSKKIKLNQHLNKFNNLNFSIPSKKVFPLLEILKYLPEKESYFETILITLNDTLVEKYLNGSINYISIHKNLLKLIKSPYFSKYYKLKPKNIYDIKKMILISKNYLNKNIKYYNA